MKRYRKTGFYFVTIFSIAVVLFADYGDLNLFFTLKAMIIVFPIILFAYFQGFNSNMKENKFLIGVLEIVIILNILIAAIYALTYSDYLIFLMGLCLILSMPNFELSENGYVGFNDPFWCYMYSSTLILGFLQFDGATEYIIPGILILILGILLPTITNNWFQWLNFRVYSLYLIITFDLMMREGKIGIYELLMPGLVQEAELNGTISIFATCLCMIACLTLLFRRIRVQKPFNLSTNY
tara:strand:- start:183 stop:899 length:717 start_codon:yes stop_codon:yes gene_type:complete